MNARGGEVCDLAEGAAVVAGLGTLPGKDDIKNRGGINQARDTNLVGYVIQTYTK